MKSVPLLQPWLFFLAGSTSIVTADSWLPPKEFEATSANGKFVAHIVPGTRQTNAHAVVYSVLKNGRRELWRVQLTNRVAPAQVFIPDDASALVTTDNWGPSGYGNDVVVIYSSKGLLANYALEQFAPPPSPKRNKEVGPFTTSINNRDAYRGKFMHTVSSRHWRQYSRETFLKADGRLLFCLWLDWDQRWVAWNMADGSLVPFTPSQVERLNLIAREQALEEIKSGEAYAAAAYNFLGRTKLKEDRRLIEAWLKDTAFSSGSRQTSSSEKSEPSFTYTSRSYKRAEADRILARWDGIADDGERFNEDYYFLGTVSGQVHLERSAQRQGTLRIYLIPFETPLAKWAEPQPQQYLTADLSHGPYRFEDGRSIYLDVGERVNFMIYGVTPGKYRLKVIWDRVAPFCDRETVLCLPSAGDYVSITSRVFEAKKGFKTEGITIDCTELVK